MLFSKRQRQPNKPQCQTQISLQFGGQAKVKTQNYNLKLKALNIFSALLKYFSPIYQYKIIGESMNPVLRDRDRVLVNRLTYLFSSPKKEDIVAVHDPRDGKILIKRVQKNEKGAYFVAGDNKNASTDSRIFGMIGKKNVVGKVIFNY